MLYLIRHRQVEGCQRKVGKCTWDVSSYSCGPYQIKDYYYRDSYKPGLGNLRTMIT